MKFKIFIFFLCISQHIFSITHTVTNTSDSGAGSLRQAIIDANADITSPITISFSIGSGVQTIIPLTALPSITNSNVTIDGSTQPGWTAGDPQIVLDGTNAASGFNGLVIDGVDNCIIQDLVIGNGFEHGILIQGNADNNQVYGCHLGIDQAGTAAFPNIYGVSVIAEDGKSNNNSIIGGPSHGNVCSGNTGGGFGVGIFISGNVNDITVQGNFVGTDKTGTSSVANTMLGVGLLTIPPGSTTVHIDGGLIGGLGTGEANVISGNTTAPGLFMGYQCVKNVTVQGNLIGSDITGTTAVPNGIGFVTFTESPGTECTLILNCTFDQNLISANPGGNFLLQLNAQNCTITGNKIGTNLAGTAILGTNSSGLGVQGNNNTIGGTTTAERNIVAGISGTGIELGFGSSNNTITNNYVGMNISGTTALPIGNNAIQVSGYDFSTQTTFNSSNNVISNNVIGSTTSGSGINLNLGCLSTTIENNIIGTNPTGTSAMSIGNNGIDLGGYDFSNNINSPTNNTTIHNNLISNCTQTGIFLNLNCNDTVITANKIGTDILGTTDMGNGNCGVQIQGYNFTTKTTHPSNGTIIGGDGSGDGNIICGSTNQGININLGVNDTIIQGNYIGIDSTGNTAIPNQQQGIYISGYDFNAPGTSSPCDNTIIGGTTSNTRNIISGNQNVGIQLNSDVNNTVIQGNYIGIGSDGTTAIGNTNNGIFIQGNTVPTCENTTIGGTTPGAGNLIGNNSSDGIFLSNNVHDSIIQGNYIGTNAAETLSCGNGNEGIFILGSNGTPCTNNLTGGTTTTAQNIIKNNTNHGISIGGSAVTPDILNAILGNKIYNNGDNGIGLFNDGNNSQITPTITSAEYCVTDNIIIVTVTAPAAPLSSNFRIEIFGNTIDNNPITEGEYYIGSIDSLATGASTTVSFSTTDIAVGNWISATATNLNNSGDTTGDTSEFTTNFLITAAAPPTATLTTISSTVCFGTSTDLTLTITGSGPFNVAWSDGLMQTAISSPVSRTVTPLTTTNYSAIVTSVYGCTNTSNTQMITVNPLPNIAISSSHQTVYPGQEVTISVTPTGNGPFTITWFDSVIQVGVTGTVQRTFTINTPTTIFVTVSDTNGCESTSAIERIFIGRISRIVKEILKKYNP